MSVTKQTTVWCDHPDPDGMVGHAGDDTLRCVEWVSVDAMGTRDARREVEKFGWSFRQGIGDCCSKHSRDVSGVPGVNPEQGRTDK